MSAPIRLPRMGQNMTEATLVSWERTTGDAVAAGDVVATIETDKTEVEIEAPSAGVLGVLRAHEGDLYPVGTVLAYVLADGEPEPADASPEPADATPASTSAAPPPVRAERRPVSPRARRMADDLDIDLACVSGTGPDGLVTEDDVQAAAAARAPMSGDRARPLTAREKTVRRNLTASWAQAPHFTQMVDADVTAASARRRALDGVTFNDLVVRALARALRAVPECNVRFADDSVLELDDVDIAIAVDTPAGLILPVVRRADLLDIDAIAGRTRELAARARTTGLAIGDVGPASATVSNLGAYGIRAGTAVLPVGQAVLVFVGAIEDRAVVRDGTIVVRSMCTLSVTYDHRVVDGVTAARLTTTIATLLEQGDQT